MKRLLAATLPPLLLSACVIHVGGTHAITEPLKHEERQLQLDVEGFTALKADTAAGELKIIGVKGARQIDISADLYYSDSKQLTLALEKQGTTAVLTATNTACVGICTGSSAYIDLVVRMPAELALTLDDGSGDITIEGLNSDLVIEDGSGDLTVQGGKNLTLEDGSGHLTLTQLSGDVTVEDGSGDINIRQVAGKVMVEDGSGDISINQVSGVVSVSDGSGDIQLQQAGGFTLLEDGSGELKIDSINGPVRLNKD